jgi:hypothetical protein
MLPPVDRQHHVFRVNFFAPISSFRGFQLFNVPLGWSTFSIRPALNPRHHRGMGRTKKRASRSNKDTELKATAARPITQKTALWVIRFPWGSPTKSGQLMCYQNRTT